jgi:precorrin-3B synthase
MRTGDGLLVRPRIPLGQMAADLAAALAECAARYGNGLIELTSRANLQLRGVDEARLGPLQARLAELGLLDADEASEAARNIIVAPLAGLDPALPRELESLAKELERRLVAEPLLQALPSKFGLAVDAAGALPSIDGDADIALRGQPDGSFVLVAGGRPVERVAARDAVEAALRWAHRFLAERQGEERRMRHLVGRLAPHMPPAPAPAPLPVAGFVRYQRAGAAFGRLTAVQLAALSRLAAERGAMLRLTPWRALLIAPVDPDPALDAAISALGLIADPADPRLAVAACPGAPACLSGEAEVLADAPRFTEALAPLLRTGATLHISGCAKGCARRAPASVTLVAEARRYRLARNADAAAPGETDLMTPEAMLAHLARLAETDPVHA